MRVFNNRTGHRLAKPLRILSILRSKWDGQRAPALQALADLGHEVVYVNEILTLEGYYKLVKKLDFDVAVLWGNSLQNFLMSFSEPFFLDEIRLPYVSLWTDNPVKHLFLLKNLNTDTHRAMFIADTRVIEQLLHLGYKNLFYLPPWHIDPEIYRPVDSIPALKCDISLAATVNPYDAERQRWRAFWDYHMNAAGDRVIEMLHSTRDHVDVFDVLSDKWDPYSMQFNLISHAMYFEQKAIVREQIVETVGEREIHITGIGSARFGRDNVIMHDGREWDDLSPVFCSATVNLNVTPWPRSCHHRVFQITASRALTVTDWREDSLELYEPDAEVIYFHTLDELPEILDRFTSYPEEAQPIAEAGYRRFISHHTAAHRMADLSNKLYELL